MQVGHGFAPVRAVIDDQSVAGLFQLELAADALGSGEKVAKNRMIFRRNRRVAGMMFFRNQKNMDRGLGGDVPKGKDVFILIHDVRGHRDR